MGGVEDPLAISGDRFTQRSITLDDGAILRLSEWQPPSDTGAEPIFFVAGWISLVTGWVPLLKKLVKTRPVYYLETREKESAEIPENLMRPESFSILRLADDLVEVSRQLGLDNDRTILFGSSMGSNAILEALKGDRLRARAAFLVGPNLEFRFPAWGRAAVRVVPAWLVEQLKPFVIWYLKTFRVNATDDPDQMARYVRTVSAADAARLKLSAVAVLDYSALPGLETISTPVAVAYAESDTLHGEEEVERLVNAMPRGSAVQCPSNTYMHTAEVAADLDRFLAGLADDRERA